MNLQCNERCQYNGGPTRWPTGVETIGRASSKTVIRRRLRTLSRNDREIIGNWEYELETDKRASDNLSTRKNDRFLRKQLVNPDKRLRIIVSPITLYRLSGFRRHPVS
jgi:hypothetical protein